MTFTDDDLKRLKALAMSTDDLYRNLEGIISRLEAAELCIKAYEGVRNQQSYAVRSTKDEFVARMKRSEALEAWRKACGR